MKWPAICSLALVAIFYLPCRAQITTENVTSSTFLRRAYHSSTVAENFLYIDGGELSFMYNGVPQTYQSDIFFSLDLSINWTAQSASLNFLDKPINCPSLNKGALWYDAPDGTIFGEFSGETSQLPEVFNQTFPQSVWRFTPDGRGSGGWNETIFATDPMWTHFTRPSSGLTAFSPEGGVYLGGYSTFTTSPQTNSLPPGVNIPLPGMVTHSYQTGIFDNETATAFGGIGTAQDGTLVYVPTFGTQGLYIALGGATTGPFEDQNYPPVKRQMDNITVYDPDSQSWYWQQATGDIPAPRINTCATGAQSNSGGNVTYEIFLYNGWTGLYGPNNSDLDALYILTLPAFHWTKVDAPSKGARYLHTCQTIGNRQMLVVGGGDPTQAAAADSFVTPDPFEQGLGLFDMVDLEWKAQYMENAAPYEQSGPIKAVYANGPRYPTPFSQPPFEAVMRTINPAASNTTTPPPPPTLTPKKAHRVSSLAIAGIVIGVLAFIILLLAGIFLLRKRQRRLSTPQFQFARYTSRYEMGAGIEPGAGPGMTRFPSASSQKEVHVLAELKETGLQELPSPEQTRTAGQGERWWYPQEVRAPVELDGGMRRYGSVRVREGEGKRF